MSLYILPALLQAVLAASESSTEQWNDFASDFATDIAPIIALFGEQVTKQFLSESTSFLDNIIFGVAPLGILTAVVSAIRVHGNSSFKSFIGRAQEPHGAAEAELCSSTSEDVCEMWSNGGICRVFGRPKILEFFYTPGKDYYPKPSTGTNKNSEVDVPSCGIKAPKISYSSNESKEPKGIDDWEETDPKPRSSLVESSFDEDFALHPNLSLNIGIRETPTWIKWAAAIFGVLLQLSFYGYATYVTFYSKFGKKTQLWPFYLVVIGTTAIVTGMTLCAALIERKSEQRRFESKCRQNSSGPGTSLCWVQPGGQRIGDQLFSSFAHSEKKDKYITSWRRENSHKYSWVLLTAAVSASITGFILQFVGMRGLHGSIALYQLAATLLMAIVRALLRARRLSRDENLLRGWNQDFEGHELDWQALCLVPTSRSSPRPQDDTYLAKTSWHINDNSHSFKPPDTVSSARGTEGITVLGLPDSSELSSAEPSVQNGHLIGFCHSFERKDELQKVKIAAQCVDLAIEWIRFNEKDPSNPSIPNDAARALYYRRRLAYLTDFPITPGDQVWDSEVRTVAVQLKEVLQDSAGYIFHNHSMLPRPWRDAKALVWSSTSRVSVSSDAASTFPIHFLMCRDKTGWKIDKHHLEAVIGLWFWSLKHENTDQNQFSSGVSPKNVVVHKDMLTSMESAIRLWVTSTEHIDVTPTCSDQTSDPGKALSVLSTMKHRAATKNDDPNFLISIQTKGTLVQRLAQDIFTIFFCRVVDLMAPLEGVDLRTGQGIDMNLRGNVSDRPNLGLVNPHIQVITEKFVNAGLGSQEEALMSTVPPLLQASKLPKLEEVMEALLTRAKSMRRNCEFERAGELLNDLLRLGPPESQHKIIAELGESYRAAIKAKDQLHRDFGQNGLRGLKTIFDDQQLPQQPSEQVKNLLKDYEAVRLYFVGRGDPNRHSPKVLDSSKWRNLTKELWKSPARSYVLTLVDEFDFRRGSVQDIQPILRWAIKENFPELIEDLWSVRKDVVQVRNGAPLLFSALGSNVETLQRLSEWPGIRHDARDENGYTLLLKAAQIGSHSCMSFLLQKTSHLGEDGPKGETPLQEAVDRGHLQVVKLLLQWDKELNLEIDRSRYLTVLEAAAVHGWFDVARFVLEIRKFDVDFSPSFDLHHTVWHFARGESGGNALAAAVMKENWDMANFLIKEGNANANAPLQTGHCGNVLAALAAHGSVDGVRFLLHNGADANKPVTYGYNALEGAINSGRSEVVKVLLNEGRADVGFSSPDHLKKHGSILMMAAHSSSLEIVQTLIEEGGADARKSSEYGSWGSVMIALMASVRSWHEKLAIAEYLIDKGHADVNFQATRNSFAYASPLAVAVNSRNHDAATYLIRNGADVNQPLHRTEYGSVLLAAATKKDSVMTRLLVKAGADVNMAAQHGPYGSPLAMLCASGQDDLVNFLIREGGADVNMPLKTGPYGNALVAAVGRAEPGSLNDLTIRHLIDIAQDNLNMPVENGRYGSALAAAAYWGNVKGVKMLLEAGAKADMVLENGDFKTASEAAEAIGVSYGSGEKVWKYVPELEKQLERWREDVKKILCTNG